MKNKNNDELNEILHWLAYTFPGVYKIWTDRMNHESFLRDANKETIKR